MNRYRSFSANTGLKPVLLGIMSVLVFIWLGTVMPLQSIAQATDPDLNNDGTVTGQDVAIVAQCKGNNPQNKPKCLFAVADTDGDGDVDNDDLQFVVNHLGETGFPTGENIPPRADAGPDQSFQVGMTVVLNGSHSIDDDGDPLTYQWILVSSPNGSSTGLLNDVAVNPSFVPDLPGAYVVQLMVNDGTVDSLPDLVSISTLNSAPVSEAGLNQTVQLLDMVYLDGSGSSDVDGDTLSFLWDLSAKPGGSMATLSDPNVVMPTFVADLPGTYVVLLTVNDGALASDVDFVTIMTVNSAPVANAGPNQTVFVTQLALLDGTGSQDDDNDHLSFSWAFVSKPIESLAALSDATSMTPSFTVDESGTYVVQLVVNDGNLDSVVDTMMINTLNSAPVAAPGSDQNVAPGSTVQLDGSQSHDVDGDALTFQWAITSLPEGSSANLSNPTVEAPNFVADLTGLYVVQLIVNDGQENSIPATVTITTENILPIAEAGPDQIVPVQSLVFLNGAGSYADDGDPLTFQWLLSSQPAGSTTSLLNPTFAQPTFIPNLPGTYVVQLVVSDGIASSTLDTVVINALENPLPSLPSLILNSPVDGTVVAFSPITATGFVSDSNATVTVNGFPAIVTSGVFVADGIVLQEGSNTIVVNGTDSQGNTNSVSGRVTLSSALPTHLDPLWGPNEWVKQTTDEEIFNASFSNCELSAQYELVVINGMAGGANRISQGTVLLNGVEVISAENFTGEHSQITQPIAVQAINELDVHLQGPIGAQVQAFIVCTANCLSINIDAPLADATINQPTMVVSGMVTTSSTSTVGVVVNQQVAKVFGSAYAVDGLPVREGTGTLGPTTVVAEATNTCGARATTSMQVQATEAPNNQVQFRVSPDRNVASSEVTMRVSIDIQQLVTQIQWDYQGDGIIDAQGPDLLEQNVTFTQPGLYQPKVIVTDDAGDTFEATAVVLVEDPVAFEDMLNAEWSGMMDALVQGNIEQALTHIHSRKREVMGHDWTVLKDHLGELATTFNVPLQLTDGRGRRVIGASAHPITMGAIQFPLEVEFVLDTDGQWRIRNY